MPFSYENFHNILIKKINVLNQHYYCIGSRPFSLAIQYKQQQHKEVSSQIDQGGSTLVIHLKFMFFFICFVKEAVRNEDANEW